MAPGPGLEPGYAASKAAVLPLDDPANLYKTIQLVNNSRLFVKNKMGVY